MATPAAVLSILVKTEGATVAGAQLQALDKSAKRSAGTLSSLGAAAKSAGAAFGVAGLALGLKRSVDEAREAQKVGAQTNAVLKSTGSVARVTAKDVGNLATAISKKAGIDDEAIQKGENLLLTFKNIRNEAGQGRDIFNQATRAAVDLSAAGFGSLESTSKQLGKALNDPVKGLTALGRAGVTFSAQQKTAITALMETGKAADRVRAQQIILREVQSQVGGSAAAQATNMDKLRVSIGNVAESAGGVLIPVLDKAAAALVAIIEVFQRSRAATSALIAVLTVAAAAWTAYKVQALAAAAATTVATGGLNLIIPVIAALSAALLVAYGRSKTFRDIVNAAFTSVKNTVTANIRTLLGAVSSMLTAVGKVAEAVGANGLAKRALAGARAIDDLRDSLNKVPAHKDVEVAVKIKLDGRDVDVSNAKPLSPTPPGGDGPGVIGSKIADAVRSSKQVHDGAKKLVADGIGALIPGIGGKVGSLMGASASLRPFAALGAQFGLHVSSGKRAAGSRTSSGGISYHGSGQAIDLANGRGPDAAKMAAFKALKSRYGSQLAELIYTPGGVGIKNGQPFTYTGKVAQDHYDHVHVAFTGGSRALGQAGNRGDGLGAFMGDGPGAGVGNAMAIARFLRSRGFTAPQVAGILGNLRQESGFNPRAIEGGGRGPGIGIAQWSYGRAAALKKFAQSRGKSWKDLGVQLAFMMHEFQGSESGAYSAVRAAKTVKSAETAFGLRYERYGVMGNRSGSQYLGLARAAGAGATSTGGAGASTRGAATAAAKVNPLDQKFANADLAIEQAKRGPITIGRGAGARKISSAMQQVGALSAKRRLIGARIRSIRKALKGKLSPAKRLALTQELTQRLGEHSQLGTDIAGLMAPAAIGGDGGSIGGDIGGIGGGGDGGTDDPNQALIDSNAALQAAIEAQAQADKEHTDAINALKAEVAAQNAIAGSTIGIGLREAQKALADMISGQLGGYGGVGSRSLTAGAGNVVRY